MYQNSNLLSRTSIRSYAYGKFLDDYREIAFSRAYKQLSENNDKQAADIFYTAIRLTRDEEAHFGYIYSSLREDPNRSLATDD